jgi:hypothetical protein
MGSITEQEFEQLCAEVAADARELLMVELFRRVCLRVGLDPDMQRADLPGNYAFVLARTLDDHMHPIFHYSEALVKHLPPTRNNA